MRRSLLTGRNALINLTIAAFAIFVVFNAIRGGDDREPPKFERRDTGNQLRLSKPISASQYVEIDGSPYLLLMAKSDDVHLETADLRIISVDPNEDLSQAGWIHTSMSVLRPPEALTYARGHVYVGLTREGTERPALWVVDLSNPGRPYEANLLHAEFPIRSLAASEDGVMVASGFGDEFLVYDISTPNEPMLLSRFESHVELSPEIYIGDSMLIIQHGAGIILYDLSDPESPEFLREYEYPEWIEPPFQPTPETYLRGDEGFDATVPRRSYLDLAISEDLIALAAGADGFSLLNTDIADEPEMYRIPEIDGRVASVAVDGESLYVLSGQKQGDPQVRFEINTVDISDPERPHLDPGARSSTVSGIPRFHKVIARDGNVWILFNQTVFRYRADDR